ncbi:DUF72 domain-containing protein [Stenotrophomonas sp.]|uniref:DUF72 domain-containing protein n=1 Tax=Stenotrophomonas sp. TaxID=69392 RepID=UPI0028A0EA22|nr:DUF72 domain-containing protein [Stenotrophomonas sp.]
MNEGEMADAAGTMRVGCAGWSLPSAHAAEFGPGGSALQRYSTRFSMVEVNSSFYRQHKPETYARWAQSVPADFRFCVKIPRAISHEHALVATAPLLDAFLCGAERLGDRLGVLLLQPPPSAAYDGRVASAFFRALRRRSNAAIACEPRHASWFTAQADAMLAGQGVARVAADPARYPLAGEPGGTRDWSYWRWHGRPCMYYSAYEEGDLKTLAGRCRESAKAGPAWIILDNTAHGHAVGNALRLQGILMQTDPTHRRPD